MSQKESRSYEPEEIDIYDFDHTIYDGDASLNFFIYSLKKDPSLLRYLPLQLWSAFLYLASLKSRKHFKESFFVFLKGIRDVDVEVAKFWIQDKNKIKVWYMSQDHEKDVIISASPSFLLEPIADDLGVMKLVATRMDKLSGEIMGKNCRGKEKVSRLREELSDISIRKAYSDNLSDLPILSLAKEPFIVDKNEVIAYENFTPSKFKQRFFRKSFLSFIFVGGLNALVGLSLAFAASMVVENKTIAYMIGYCLGLPPSYFLNSYITFHNTEYSLRGFVKYCISYLPNFFVQVISVGIFIEILDVNKAAAYILAVMIGVPMTFLIVSVLAIKEKEIE